MSSRYSSEFIQVKTTKKKTDALLGWGTGTMEKEGGGGRSSLLEVSDRNGWCKYQKKRRSTGDDKYIAKDLRRTPSIYVPVRIFPLLFTCGIKERDNSKDCYCRGGNGSIMMEQRGCMWEMIEWNVKLNGVLPSLSNVLFALIGTMLHSIALVMHMPVNTSFLLTVLTKSEQTCGGARNRVMSQGADSVSPASRWRNHRVREVSQGMARK